MENIQHLLRDTWIVTYRECTSQMPRQVRNQRAQVSVQSGEKQKIYVSTSQQTESAVLHDRVKTEDIRVDFV